MKPANLKTKIFLDSGDPEETKQVLTILGFLDGQTTNPSLIAKSPKAQERIAQGEKFTKEEVNEFYKKVVQEVSNLIPDGSVSIEVFADANTSAEEMLIQARQMNTWIPNAHIKYPTTAGGLGAAEKSIAEGMRVNMTLVFSEEQAASVYAATKGAPEGHVFLSPFIGRLDDTGINGMDFIKNVVELYKNGDGHVEVLAASIRSLDHLLASFAYGAEIVTVPYKVLKDWVDAGTPVPDANFVYGAKNLTPIDKQDVSLGKNWNEYDISHELTDKGIKKFVTDWNDLIA